jgi:hypothetical protein
MHDFHQRQRGTTTVHYEDNEGAAKLASNPMASNKTKHIDIKHHYIRELVDAKTIAVVSICTLNMFDGGWPNEGIAGAEAYDDLQALHESGAK